MVHSIIAQAGNNLEISLEDFALEIKLSIAEAFLISNKDENNERCRASVTEWLTEISTTKADSELPRRAQEHLEEIKSDDLRL